jgi:predicted Zn-dependent protease
MRPIRRGLFALLLGSLFAWSCSTVPVTGRKQFNIIPNDTMLSMSFQQYQEFLQTNPLSQNAEQTAMVKRTGQRIQNGVEAYFNGRGMADQLAGYAWEFNLVESEEVNAWCMPGGKVVVYTGLLKLVGSEAELAVVMGHEIAHAVAQHGNERMSQGLVAQLGGMALSKALEEKPAETQQLWMTAFGLGAQVGVLLPFSRQQESEADHLGLIFMAMAGYDPNAALTFWQKMASESGGQAPPEFISTHPSDETRIRNIRSLLPEAMGYYKPASGK